MKISRGLQTGPQKVVLYGPEGIGKSTFGAQFPAPLFLDVEQGTRHIDVARIDPAPASWTALLETVKEFLAERPKEFATLVLDTADWAEQLCIDSVCKRNQWSDIQQPGYGRGPSAVMTEFGKLLNNLNDVVEAGYNVVILAHSKMRKFEEPNEAAAYDRWELKLLPGSASMVKEWCDMLLFANYKSIVLTSNDGKKGKAQGQGKRVIYTTHHSCWDAKNRHGLPDELPLDYGQIAHCIPGLTAGQTSPPAEAGPSETPNSAPAPQPAPDPLRPPWSPDLPGTLRQLMEQSRVTEEEVRGVIQSVGHFTGDTPWTVLQERGYVDGYIIPQWDYFVTTIESDPDRLPF